MSKKMKRAVRSVPVRPVNPREQALAELDRLLWEHERRVLDDWQVAPRVREVAEIVGPRLFDELVNRIWTPADEIRSSVVWALGILAGNAAIPRLWEIVRTSHRSVKARLGALEALERMGVRVEPAQVPADLLEKIGLAGRRGLRTIIASIERARMPAEVEDAVLPVLRLAYGPTESTVEHGIAATLAYIGQALRRADRPAADFLLTLASTTPVPIVRTEAERAIALLRSRGIVAAQPAVLALHAQRFFRALILPVPQQPTQTRIVVAWERGDEPWIRAFIFTIDVEEWHGGLRTFEATPDLDGTVFRKRFVEEAWLAGTPPRDLSFEEVRQRVADALQANARFHVPLPSDYLTYQPLVDRYLLQPAAAQPMA